MMFCKFGVKYLINQSCSVVTPSQCVLRRRLGVRGGGQGRPLLSLLLPPSPGNPSNSISHAGDFQALAPGTWHSQLRVSGVTSGRSSYNPGGSTAPCQRSCDFMLWEVDIPTVGPGRGEKEPMFYVCECACVCERARVFGSTSIKYFRIDMHCLQGENYGRESWNTFFLFLTYYVT